MENRARQNIAPTWSKYDSLMIKLNTGFFKGPIWLIVENLRALASMEVELAKYGPKHGLYVVQTWLSNGLEKIKSIN